MHSLGFFDRRRRAPTPFLYLFIYWYLLRFFRSNSFVRPNRGLDTDLIRSSSKLHYAKNLSLWSPYTSKPFYRQCLCFGFFCCFFFGHSSSNAFFAHLTPSGSITQAHSREKGTAVSGVETLPRKRTFQHALQLLTQHVWYCITCCCMAVLIDRPKGGRCLFSSFVFDQKLFITLYLKQNLHGVWCNHQLLEVTAFVFIFTFIEICIFRARCISHADLALCALSALFLVVKPFLCFQFVLH